VDFVLTGVEKKYVIANTVLKFDFKWSFIDIYAAFSSNYALSDFFSFDLGSSHFSRTWYVFSLFGALNN